MDYKQTLEELDEALLELREDNKLVPIIVEGDKDIAALRKFEMPGEIIRFNKGQSVADFCDIIAQRHPKIILLTDWDWRGGRLCLSIKKNLENRVNCNLRYREVFAKRCPCRTVEGLPSWIATLRKKLEGE
jgi:5S rRNA maturation endonuclease (ribonuclease M5)